MENVIWLSEAPLPTKVFPFYSLVILLWACLVWFSSKALLHTSYFVIKPSEKRILKIILPIPMALNIGGFWTSLMIPQLVQCSLLPYVLGFWMPSAGTVDIVLQLLPWSSECTAKLVHLPSESLPQLLSWSSCGALKSAAGPPACFRPLLLSWSSCGALNSGAGPHACFVLVACTFIVCFEMLSSGHGMAIIVLKSHP